MLGDDSGSRLYWELVDPGLAEQASLSHGEHQGAGMMMTYLTASRSKRPTNLQRILDLYRQVESAGVTAAELEQAKSKIRSRIVLSAERPRGRLVRRGQRLGLSAGIWTGRGGVERVAGISADDIATVLAKYPLTRPTTVTIGPLAKVAEPSGKAGEGDTTIRISRGHGGQEERE